MPTLEFPANLRSGVHDGVGVRGGHDPPERLPGAVPGPGRDAGAQHAGQRDLPGLLRGVQDARCGGVRPASATMCLYIVCLTYPIGANLESLLLLMWALSRRSRRAVHSHALACAVLCLTYLTLLYPTLIRQLQVRSCV